MINGQRHILKLRFLLQGRELLAFERYVFFKSKGGNHLQFNVLSIPAKSPEDVKSHYLAVAKQNSLNFKPFEGPAKVYSYSDTIFKVLP